ncbi:alanine racemase [Gemella sp. GH3]|uniref:alanine racemase n=1 Tax=unclassified Gemella TaxID=2624949 RepID=UPI0015D03218|nr:MULTISPECIES: alanine racemase [unclassified Gemella]MBF0713994.1 alanine racemase [Gemella sp. GH3.1]NYS50946.1 alanine racemase [Gemella sp. GH3]
MIQDRPTYLKVNLDNILFNYNSIKNNINNKEIMAILKADAYGLGAKVVGKYLYENGVKTYGVATLEEALELKTVVEDSLILVLGVINPKNINIAIENNISLCCPSVKWLENAISNTKDNKSKLKLHLKIDSGMSRIGITSEEEARKINDMVISENIALEGIFTHYANADDSDNSYDYRQREIFDSIVSQIKLKPKYIHQENSAASIKYAQDESKLNLVRIGIALYGSYPSADIQEETDIPLKNVSSLISEVVHIKEIPEHSKVGYGCSYETENKEFIATIPIGYRDGILRFSQGWNVIVNGKKCEIVGRVCMDQLMIRCDKDVRLGDKVIFYGHYNDYYLPVEEYANYLKTIPYEIYCLIGSRVLRKYYINNKELEKIE